MGYIQHKSEESVEDYLETILVLSKRLPVVLSLIHIFRPDFHTAYEDNRHPPARKNADTSFRCRKASNPDSPVRRRQGLHTCLLYTSRCV